MRHKRICRSHRRPFFAALSGAAFATAAAAALGYAIAYSPLAGWILIGLAAAITASLWLEARADRLAGLSGR